MSGEENAFKGQCWYAVEDFDGYIKILMSVHSVSVIT